MAACIESLTLLITPRLAPNMNSKKTLILLMIVTAFFDASAGEDRPLQAQRQSLRQDLARRVFAEHSEMSREDRRESIQKGRIDIGMTPYEAKLAGGGSFHTKLFPIPPFGRRTLIRSKSCGPNPSALTEAGYG